MDIREFLFYEKMTMGEFADIVRISRTHMHRIVNLGHIPCERILEDIEKATKGKVPIPEGLYSPDSVRRRNK